MPPDPPPATAARLQAVRRRSEELIAPLEPEDLCLQGMADASPPKWHLGHTTWFFSTFVLEPHAAGLLPGDASAWSPPDPRWGYLFNSYYETVGRRQPRPQRGLLTRPPIGAVLAWRRQVDRSLTALIQQLEQRDDTALGPALEALLELGLQHEQQHQELLLMDLLDGFWRQPLAPAYRRDSEGPEALWRERCTSAAGCPQGWLPFEGGLVEIGHAGVTDGPQAAAQAADSFHFDNEGPRHRQWLEPFELASTLVRNHAYEAFIADGGYRRPELWMSEGWAVVAQRGWQAPRYWHGAQEFTLAGLQRRDPQAPVRHMSWLEADAYARWAGARLPSEAEWEHAATTGALPEAFGLVWQWTASPYRPYPGFQPAPGAVGEYNGKFMTSQFVLRGSCFLTPDGHARLSYRNFYPPASRWMAAGLRLAR
ncbi:MAG: ergothioneine biosynthesis protein EgtB [Cyanobium sp.]